MLSLLRLCGRINLLVHGNSHSKTFRKKKKKKRIKIHCANYQTFLFWTLCVNISDMKYFQSGLCRYPAPIHQLSDLLAIFVTSFIKFRLFTRSSELCSFTFFTLHSSTPYLLPQKTNLRVMTVNSRSLFEKQSEFKAVIDYVIPDIVCCSESWLLSQPWEAPTPGTHQDFRGIP